MNANIESQSAIMSYLDINPIATLGTINPDGSPHGAIVYVCTDMHKPMIYFITKTGTTKYKNILADNRVSITVTHPSENSTLQAKGVAAEIQDDAQVIDTAMQRLTKLHVNATDWLQPIAKIRAGAYVLVGVTLQWARLAEYEGMSIGDERVFTQLEA
jgi:general stress protein 26